MPLVRHAYSFQYLREKILFTPPWVKNKADNKAPQFCFLCPLFENWSLLADLKKYDQSPYAFFMNLSCLHTPKNLTKSYCQNRIGFINFRTNLFFYKKVIVIKPW